MTLPADVMQQTRARVVNQLVEQASADGYWEGELASSALATATALFALHLYGGRSASLQGTLEEVTEGAVNWLTKNSNEDGGWGDTLDSPSNISTTTLVWAALRATSSGSEKTAIHSAEEWIKGHAGGLGASEISGVITRHYGKDRTFATPILTMCALAGCFGSGDRAWRAIPALPFELAIFPPRFFRFLRLPVVSYALPALIAIGQVQHHHYPSSNPLTRWVRRLSQKRTLRLLDSIQPDSGGFLEAVPLTAFISMSLIAMGLDRHPVVQQAIRFLLQSGRLDGSWPIDSNLSCWLTSLSVQALGSAGRLDRRLTPAHRRQLARWLLDQQYHKEHPYTHSPPGGWAWTHLSGGVPDADDTAGALVALHHLAASGAVSFERCRQAAEKGVEWLLQLQNRDGGIPTFCRGWGKLDFDRSAPDLTAHAVRAWRQWRDRLPDWQAEDVDRGGRAALAYLLASQRADGEWIPLWFGNQREASRENPVYGTSRVLLAADAAGGWSDEPAWRAACGRGCRWLLDVQNSDGGWGGGFDTPSSLEETAWALEALTTAGSEEPDRFREAVDGGIRYLVEKTVKGEHFVAAPVGLYFARLWYSERLYPIIFSASALERAGATEFHEVQTAEKTGLSSAGQG